MVEDIEKIRKDTITGIKKKVKKDPKYLNSANKERQEDMRTLKFANGYNDQECLKELEKYEFVNGLEDLKESKRP